MAATGYTPISLYYSTTASAVPTAGNLANGELALNIADMKLYAKNSAGTVTLLASNASTTGVDSLSFGSTGLTPSTATTGAITVAGTLATTNGGTGLTSFTANGVLYASSTSALTSGSALTFDGTNLKIGASSITAGFLLDAQGASRFGANTGAVELSYNAGTFTASVVSYDRVNSAYRLLALDGSEQVFRLSNSEQMRLTSTGLGIGTSSPTRQLQVSNASNAIASVICGAKEGVLNATTVGINVGSASNDFLSISTNGTERFRVGTAGQLGIGGATYGTSGQVLTSGGSGAAPTWTTPASGGGSFTAKTTNYTAASGDNILADTSSASWTLTLPASPTTGNSVQVMDSKGSFGQYPLTVARNGSTIMGASEDMTMAVNGAATTFVYNGSTWRVI